MSVTESINAEEAACYMSSHAPSTAGQESRSGRWNLQHLPLRTYPVKHVCRLVHRVRSASALKRHTNVKLYPTFRLPCHGKVIPGWRLWVDSSPPYLPHKLRQNFHDKRWGSEMNLSFVSLLSLMIFTGIRWQPSIFGCRVMNIWQNSLSTIHCEHWLPSFVLPTRFGML